MDEIKSFSVNLKRLREQNNITQKELAEKIGVTAATISAYENMSKKPSLDIALGIAHALGVSIDELCNRKPVQITTFDQFILYFTELVKSQVLYPDTVYVNQGFVDEPPCEITCFNIRALFNDFAKGFCQIYQLYQNGTIPQKLFDLWIKDQMGKYSQVNIHDAIEHNDLHPIRKNEFQEITRDDDLPF